jgi:hypothetical protein
MTVSRDTEPARGPGRSLVRITTRSEVTQDRWKPLVLRREARFAMPPGPRDAAAADDFRVHFGLPPLVVERTLQTISVLVPGKPAAPPVAGAPS